MPLISDKKSFTLVEILVVIIIVGILVALSWPIFTGTKERTVDKEAKANLKLLQAAEEIYRMEKGTYYPAGTTTSVIRDINSYLKLGLPISQPNWTYGLDTTSAGSEKAMATRVGAGGRIWTIFFPAASSDNPTCSGTGCP